MAKNIKKTVKLAKGGKVGRPKKLTPEALKRGVEAYFTSISYLEPVWREEPVVLDEDPETGGVTYALDEYGHRLMRRVPVLDAKGEQLQRLVYTQPPGDFGLCDYLKISRDTWERYGAAHYDREPGADGYDEAAAKEAEDYAAIYALARGRICAYLEKAAEEKGGRGAQFKLERLYGLTGKQEVVVGAAGTVEEYLRGLGEGVTY